MNRNIKKASAALVCVVAGFNCFNAAVHAGDGPIGKRPVVQKGLNQLFSPTFPSAPSYCGDGFSTPDWFELKPDWLDPSINLPSRFSSSRFSSNSNRIALQNIPLLQALSQIGKITSTKILVTGAAKELLLQSEKRVDLKARNADVDKLVDRVLKSTGLTAAVDGKRVIVSASSESAENVEESDLTPLDQVTLNSALESPVDFVFGTMPASSALSMLSAQTGVPIYATGLDERPSFNSIDPVLGSSIFHGSEKWVHIDRGSGRTLRMMLKSIAEQVGAEIEIVDGAVRFMKPDEKK